MTLTSKIGNLNRESAFTLIELIVVLAVMGTVFFITLPKFRTLNFYDSSERGVNILLNTVRELKKRAISDDTDYILHINMVKSVMWVTSEIMNRVGDNLSNNPKTDDTDGNVYKNIKDIDKNENDKKAKENAIPLPNSIYIKGVEIYGLSNRNTQEEYQIRFSSQGYCDMTIIHIKDRESQEDISMIIEPFLYSPQIKKKNISFEQCR